jgi:hypothetical protein
VTRECAAPLGSSDSGPILDPGRTIPIHDGLGCEHKVMRAPCELAGAVTVLIETLFRHS